MKNFKSNNFKIPVWHYYTLTEHDIHNDIFTFRFDRLIDVLLVLHSIKILRKKNHINTRPTIKLCFVHKVKKYDKKNKVKKTANTINKI